MKKLHWDIETRSRVNLKKSGQYVYAEDWSTQIILSAWAIDDEKPEVWNMLHDPMPARLRAACLDPDVVLCAHNASFERVLLSITGRRQGCVPADVLAAIRPIARWDCTAARVAAIGLPRALENATEALKLDIQKDMEGKKLMLRMCVPRGIDMQGKPLWRESPEEIKRLGEYCVVDVQAEQAVDKAVPDLPTFEKRVWAATERMNDRGLPVDDKFLRHMILFVEDAELAVNAKLSAATGGAVTKVSGVAKLKKWLGQQGIDFDPDEDKLNKSALAQWLDDGSLPPLVREVLTMRKEGGKSSASKYKAMLDRINRDLKVRGCLVYCGAAATHRWSSKGFQAQNMSRGGTVKNVIGAMESIVDGDTLDMIAEKHGPPMVVASELIRPTIMAPADYWIARGDFAQIELRVGNWLAGEEENLKAFRAYDTIVGADAKGKPVRGGPDIYIVSAANMAGVPTSTIDAEDPRRQTGKVCLGASTLVLTQHGYVPITSVEVTDQLWDGDQWVTHSGLVDQGTRQTIQWLGVDITPGHLLLSDTGWITAQTASSCANTTCRVLARGSANLPWLDTKQAEKEVFSAFGCGALAEPESIWSQNATCGAERQHAAPDAVEPQLQNGEKTIGATPIYVQMQGTDAGCSTGLPRALHDASRASKADYPNTTPVEEFESTNPGQRERMDGELSFNISSGCLDGMFPLSVWTESTRTGITPLEISDLSVGQKTAQTSAESVICNDRLMNCRPVYDLTNAGPNRRFTILTKEGPVIVHNCELALGFLGGIGALQNMAKLYNIKLSDEKAQEIVDQWRASRQKTVGFANGLLRAAMDCMNSEPGEYFRVGKHITFRRNNRALSMRLPSGNSLLYWYPKIENLKTKWKDKITGEPIFKDTITYLSEDSQTKRWTRFPMWRGLLIENAVQAIARDIMADAIVRLDEGGLCPILTVHDEGIAMLPKAMYPDPKAAAKAVEDVMLDTPAWAKGIPVAAEASAHERYIKLKG